MKPIWIELVNSGVANRYEFDDKEVIEMNWRLTKYPQLYHEVFKHEIKHESGDFKIEDLIHDMKSRTVGLFMFMRNHISAWTQILPIYWSRRHKMIVYDISAMVSWLVIICIGSGIFTLLGWLL